SSIREGQAGEVAKRDQLTGHLIESGEPDQGIVECHELVRGDRGRRVELLEVHSLPVAPALLAMLAACPLDEDSPHGFGGRREEVTAALPLLSALDVDQADIRFVNQRCCL